jgi:hypothetical protein
VKTYYLLILSLAAGLFLGCDGKKSGDTASGDANMAENTTPPSTESTPEVIKEDAVKGPELVYSYHDVTYDMSLSVLKKTGAIEFIIEVTNSDNACERQVKGTAKAKQGDLESREIDGEAVFVQEYTFESPECSLSISIDMDSEAYAWVTPADCKDVDPLCRLDIGTFLSLKE